MIKTLTLDGLTSVTIKQSPYDMARFCWMYNHSDSDVFASCVNSDCTENADGVLRVPAGETRMLDSESYETLYLNGSGTVEIITSAFAVCPFSRAAKGGESGCLTEIYRGWFSSSSSSPTVFDCDISSYTAIIICPVITTTTDGTEATVINQICPSIVISTYKITSSYAEFMLCSHPYNSNIDYTNGYIKCDNREFSLYSDKSMYGGIIIYGI